MPRFSIIIPVYNTEKYLRNCLDSVFSQSFSDYEVIVIDDGCTDKSIDIVKEYDVNLIKNSSETIGPSSARNLGISVACGDYLLFLDSDDYYDADLLSVLDSSLDDDYDIVRFELQYEGISKKLIGCSKESIYSSGLSAFNDICKFSIVESPCCYAFKRNYFLDNNFKFMENTLHEDFGLIPLVIIKAGKVKLLDYVGYNYVVHENSIMTFNEYSKVLKKAYDFLEHFIFLKNECSNLSGDLSIFKSYIANSVILKSISLKKKDYKKYILSLKENGAFDMLLADTLGRKIKKFFIRVSPKLYYKLVRR